MEIRTLDMSKLTSGTHDVEKEFCGDLVNCLSYQGFVKLRNHPIPEDIIEEAFIWVSIIKTDIKVI